jgi:hypothetical protein
MTWKASPLYKAEQDGQRDSMRVPQRFACSVEDELPVRESVAVRRSMMGCEHAPTIGLRMADVLTTANSRCHDLSVKKVATVGVFFIVYVSR